MPRQTLGFWPNRRSPHWPSCSRASYRSFLLRSWGRVGKYDPRGSPLFAALPYKGASQLGVSHVALRTAVAAFAVVLSFAGIADAAPRADLRIGVVLEPPALDPTAGAAAAIDEVVYQNVF